MTLDEIDKTGLIRESFEIEGISLPECRSIFLDWAIKLPTDIKPQSAISFLLHTYGHQPADHPMMVVLNEGLNPSKSTGRRGGRKARLNH